MYWQSKAAKIPIPPFFRATGDFLCIKFKDVGIRAFVAHQTSGHWYPSCGRAYGRNARSSFAYQFQMDHF
jgi:hypothetical protein